MEMNILKESYCAFVNMDHRTDRLIHITSQLERIGLKADRVRGMRPNEYTGDPKRVNKMRKRTPGAIGCHFSQVQIMKTALEKEKHAFVMEDDLVFCQDFNDRIEIISEFMTRTKWDVFWLGGTFHSPAFWHPIGRSNMQPDCSAHLGKDCEEIGEERILRIYGAFCTYAYIVNRDSIQKVLDLLDKYLHHSIGIDWLFIKLQPQLNTFAFVPGSVKQMDGQSDIGTGITRFSGFAKLNGNESNSRYWFQERMEDFNSKEWTWK